MRINKILYLAFIASVVLFSACGDDDINDAMTSAISVVKAKGTMMKSYGGQDTIILNREPSVVYSTSDWLTVENQGAMVLFKSDINYSKESRNALLVMKYSDKDSTVVNVTQEGLILKYEGNRVIVHSYKAIEKMVKIKTNAAEKVTIISQPSWISATLKTDSLFMQVSENVNGNTAADMRMGYVKFGIGERVDSVKVIQYYWTNLRGNNKWVLLGYPVTFDEYGSYQINTANSAFLRANLSFFGTKGTFTFPNVQLFSNLPALNLKLETVLDYDNMSFSFKNGQFLGSVGDSIHIAETTIAAGYQRGFISSAEARFDLDMDDSGMLQGRITGAFPVDGGNLDIIGLWFCAFKSKEFTADAYYGQGKGDIWGLTPCWLLMPKAE